MRTMNIRLRWYRLTHHIASGKNWLLIVGSDFSNSDWGVTFNHGVAVPFGGWKRWRTELRVNVRWPVQIRFRRRRY